MLFRSAISWRRRAVTLSKFRGDDTNALVGWEMSDFARTLVHAKLGAIQEAVSVAAEVKNRCRLVLGRMAIMLSYPCSQGEPVVRYICHLGHIPFSGDHLAAEAGW
jgi:hypothetical protein